MSFNKVIFIVSIVLVSCNSNTLPQNTNFIYDLDQFKFDSLFYSNEIVDLKEWIEANEVLPKSKVIGFNLRLKYKLYEKLSSDELIQLPKLFQLEYYYLNNRFDKVESMIINDFVQIKQLSFYDRQYYYRIVNAFKYYNDDTDFYYDEVLNSLELKDNSEVLLQYYFLDQFSYKIYSLYLSSNISEAFSHLFYALGLFKKWNLENKFPLLFSRYHSIAGIVYLGETENDQAINNFERAICYSENVKYNKNWQCRLHVNLANIFLYDGKVNDALGLFEYSQEKFKAVSPRQLSYLFFCYATALESIGQFDQAIKSIEKSKSLFSESVESDLRKQNFIANIYIKQNKLDSAEVALSYHDEYNFNINFSRIFLFNVWVTKLSYDIAKFKSTDKVEYLKAAEVSIGKMESLFQKDLNRTEYFHFSDINKSIAGYKMELQFLYFQKYKNNANVVNAFNISLKSKSRTIEINRNKADQYISNKSDIDQHSNLSYQIDKILKDINYFKLEKSKIRFTQVDSLYYLFSKRGSLIMDSIDIQSDSIMNFDEEYLNSFCEEKEAQVLDYFWAYDYLFLTYLSKDTSFLKRISLDSVNWIDNSLIGISTKKYNFNTFDKLYSSLKLECLDQSHKNVLLILDDILSSIPFDAIKTDDEIFLIEKYNISTLSSPSDININGRKESIQKIKLFAFGDLDDIEAQTYAPLKYSINECENIFKIFDVRSKKIYSGLKSTKKNFKKALNSDILHFAGHSVSGMGSYLDNYLILRDEDGNPEPLYAYEIKYMQPKVKHAVLSSCDSGIGVYKPGEGTFSLSRAFLESGAEAVTKSLWKVNDQSTAMLMEEYYKNMKTMPLSEALRQAKLSLMNNENYPELRHPYYWAPFVLEGNPFLQFEFN